MDQSATLEAVLGETPRIGVTSFGLRRTRNLPSFLGFPSATIGLATRTLARNFDLFVGWGNMASGQRARELAGETGKPFLLLEDGFVRSLAPHSVSGEPPLSLVIDDRGIYYDASAASRLEDLVLTESASLNERARTIMSALKRNRLSKYNNFAPVPDGIRRSMDPDRNVLVVDQTRGDSSVAGALADRDDFRRMIEAAIDENPGAQIWIKIHPEVLAGRKQGYLKDVGTRLGCRFIDTNVNPWDLFDHVGRCYTVSSQLGFEALIAGRDVRCFGVPFYAGWGLTGDEIACARRASKRPGLEQIFAAAYLQYSRYVDPYSGAPTTLEHVIDLLGDWRRAYERNRALGPMVNISPWKAQAVRRMFQKPEKSKEIFFLRSKGAIKAARASGRPVISWASKIEPRLKRNCDEAGVELQRLEDGFIRSIGLGTNFHPPMSLIHDTRGIYYDANRPSDLEVLLSKTEFTPELTARARALMHTLVDNGISKYNTAEAPFEADLPSDVKTIFVPGQVESDASIRHGDCHAADNADLLRKVRESEPDAFIIYKPHPDVVSGQRKGLQDEELVRTHADLHVETADPLSIVARIDEVHTLTSLTGFEALIRGKKVHCYGMPFYAGWGLTADAAPCPRRTRQLTLEQLVAGALILYPHYYDPLSGLPCGPEIVVQRIMEGRDNPDGSPLLIAARELSGQIKRLFVR